MKSPLVWLILIAIVIALFTLVAPLERTLGRDVRIVYLHGAWVWTAILSFIQSALVGLVSLITRRGSIHHWSRAWGRTAMVFWLTFLPMSLYVMEVSWNGLFLDEPRWRIPLNLAIVGMLLQIGLSLLPVVWSSLGNLVFGLVLFFSLGNIETVLHPQAVVINSDSSDIRFFFFGLLFLLLLAAWQISRWWWQLDRRIGANDKAQTIEEDSGETEGK